MDGVALAIQIIQELDISMQIVHVEPIQTIPNSIKWPSAAANMVIEELLDHCTKPAAGMPVGLPRVQNPRATSRIASGC